ncbi:MAG: FAD-dependent oxidoreductase [Herminiimonas sp.]|nr:FAD-dependent oxidoreductase [Herminiimonas sp.]
MKPIVIIGAGMAGFTVARELRKLDKEIPLVILTSDAGGFYSKPMLSNAFAQNKHAAQLVTQSAEQMAAQLNATIIASTSVHGVDTAAKSIETDGAPIDYEKLVLAVGAQPIRLAIDGDGADQVQSVNHVSDYARFRELVALPKHGTSARVTILGAGLIGCEFADDLRGAGHAVALVDPSPLPLAALAAPALSRALQTALTARGIVMHLSTTATRIDRQGENLQVTLASGVTFETDIVLSAVGLRPNLSVARQAGLATGRGILIDASGQTSAADVYAVGDCAEYVVDADGGTRILPYIAPLMTAARAIARTLTGTPTTIDIKDAPVIVKTPSFPIALVPPPLQAQAGGTWQDEEIDGRTICRFYDAGGIMAGFCVAPQDAAIRSTLMAGLGSPAAATSPAS